MQPIIHIILFEKRCRLSLEINPLFERFLTRIFPKSCIRDQRKKKPRNSKKTNAYARYKQEVRNLYGNRCAKCGVSGEQVQLSVHHIHSFSKYPSLKLHSDNGVLLCEDHHREYHETYGFKEFSEEDLWKYLGGFKWTWK